MSRQSHWQKVYQEKETNSVSWYRAHLDTSIGILQGLSLPSDFHILDAGGGASTFVDDVLQMGFSKPTVVDLADAALAKSRERLQERAELVNWLAGDITQLHLPERSVDFWHDRAVFHFLTDVRERDAYIAQLRRTLTPAGYVLLATFHLDGPEKCSGLEVQRYDADMLSRVLGSDFRLVDTRTESHVTPWQSEQRFVYALFERTELSA